MGMIEPASGSRSSHGEISHKLAKRNQKNRALHSPPFVTPDLDPRKKGVSPFMSRAHYCMQQLIMEVVSARRSLLSRKRRIRSVIFYAHQNHKNRALRDW